MSKYGNVVGSKFRLSVCLKRFYSDERRRCYISAASGLRVRWLARRLRRLFSLPGHFCLLAAGHLLPPDENLDLLSPDDVVEVIPKHYRIFEETSDSEDEQVSNKSDQNYHDRENEEERITNTVGIHKPCIEQTDGPMIIQDGNNSILGKSVFPNKQQIKRSEFSQDIDHNESGKVARNKLDSVKTNSFELLHQCSFSQNKIGLDEVVQQEEEIRMSQEIEHVKLDEKDNELYEVKQKALKLLDKCSRPQKRKGTNEVEDEDLEGVKTKPLELVSQCDISEKKKRKRVRRRKPRAMADSEDIVDSTEPKALPQTPSNHIREVEGHLDHVHGDSVEESSLDETFILRNNKEQNRTARLVYSLS